MKKRLMITGLIVALLAVGGSVYAYMALNDDDEATETTQSTNLPADDAKTAQELREYVPDDDLSATAPGGYITLAEYNANKATYQDSRKVYFFHAPWCEVCQAIENEINADPSQLPSDVVVIKTDFDTETKLRQQYGVTSQYTFVQVNNDGNEIDQWSAANLNGVLTGLSL